MNSASQRNNDYLPDIPPNMAEKDQIKFLHKYIAQLWKKQIDDRNTIDKLLSLVNSEVSTKRIIEIINGLNTHTGEMPDRKGENRDHDMRYVQKSALRSLIVSTGLIDSEVPVRISWDGTTAKIDIDTGSGYVTCFEASP